MSASWNFFRVICLLQMMQATYFAFISFIAVFNSGKSYFLLETFFFVLIAALPVLALNLLGSNYPDRPVAGTQKRVFNWLFLLNFLLLAFLFGLFFAEYRQLKLLASLLNRSVFSFPFRVLLPLISKLALIIFQIVVLFGMYTLRRELYINFFTSKQFEFEEKTGNR